MQVKRMQVKRMQVKRKQVKRIQLNPKKQNKTKQTFSVIHTYHSSQYTKQRLSDFSNEYAGWQQVTQRRPL